MKRWEAQRGLPVHRLPGGARTTVYAYASEMDGWLKSVSASLGAAADSVEPAAISAGLVTRPSATRRSWAIVLGGAALLVAAVVFSDMRLASVSGSAPLAGDVAPQMPGRVGSTASTVKPEVVDLYLRGTYYWNKRTPDDLNRAVHFFTRRSPRIRTTPRLMSASPIATISSANTR